MKYRAYTLLSSVVATGAALLSFAAPQTGPAGGLNQFTYHDNRRCGPITAGGAPWCFSAAAYLGHVACCDYCKAPKVERQCSNDGDGCTQITYVDGPATCGDYRTCGTVGIAGVCVGGALSGVCYRRFCN